MNKAWIIINQFLKTKKFSELYEYFRSALNERNIEFEIFTNAEVLGFINEEFEEPSFVIFWDKDIRLAKLMESMGLKLFNSASAIEICDDKYLTYLKLKEKGVETPLTLTVPMTFSNIDITDFSFVNRYGDILGYPMVIKENFGSFGEQVFLAKNSEEAINIIKQAESRPVICQKFIKESFGKDIRVNIVGGKIVASMNRMSVNGDFRANLSIGGKMEKVVLDEKAQNLALHAASAIGLDFCGVDLLHTDNGYTVCEVNSNAHFKNIMDLTGVNFAKEIIKYIEETL